MTQLPFPMSQRIEIERTHFPNGVNAAQITMLDDIEKRLAEVYKAGYEQSSIFGFHEWSNNAAMGYTAMALEQLGYDSIEIQRVINKMYRVFDEVSVLEAKTHYDCSDY
jgi:Holliday junction resolvasome RuvABC DNA-binding subunit